MWQVKIHFLASKEDFKKINKSQQIHLLDVIRKRLSVDPLGYGKPLSGRFSGYWKLKVGDFRIIYKIIKKEVTVLVIKIGLRKDYKVYKELFFRLRKLSNFKI